MFPCFPRKIEILRPFPLRKASSDKLLRRRSRELDTFVRNVHPEINYTLIERDTAPCRILGETSRRASGERL
jgi:hypothetical protein